MGDVWKTKYGLRRVRHDPPVIEEAIAAAQGLTEDLDEQAVLAAELIGAPVAEIKAEMTRLSSKRRPITVTSTDRKGISRAVIVERRPSRMPLGSRVARP